MRHNESSPKTADQIAQYFSKPALPTQQETLGSIVSEILTSGKNLNRKALCTLLLRRIEHASCPEEERHFQQLIGLLFGRDTH